MPATYLNECFSAGCLYVAPLGLGSDCCRLPTACAVGYEYFVRCADWLDAFGNLVNRQRELLIASLGREHSQVVPDHSACCSTMR
jgi:hypothetical protein